jgi:hypothetical protein
MKVKDLMRMCRLRGTQQIVVINKSNQAIIRGGEGIHRYEFQPADSYALDMKVSSFNFSRDFIEIYADM